MIYIGTSGYSYKDWIGPFYPKGTKPGDMLSFYREEFNFTEINSTYYNIPTPQMFFNMHQKTGDDFVFTVKLHQSMTHLKNASEGDYRNFTAAADILRQAKKLGCLVAQFPYSFHYNASNKDYLLSLKDRFKDFDLVVEFRNSKWLREDVFHHLRQNQIGYVCVDEPALTGLVDSRTLSTSKTAYIRFHGRNADKWWEHNESYERYDYLYSDKELGEWTDKVKGLEEGTEKCFVSFNNHFKAQAVINGRMLREMLGLQGGGRLFEQLSFL